MHTTLLRFALVYDVQMNFVACRCLRCSSNETHQQPYIPLVVAFDRFDRQRKHSRPWSAGEPGQHHHQPISKSAAEYLLVRSTDACRPLCELHLLISQLLLLLLLLLLLILLW